MKFIKGLGLFAMVLAISATLSACKYLNKGATDTTSTSGTQTTGQQQAADPAQAGTTITFGDKGFELASVTVKSGDTITWVNNSAKKVQIGSADHPTHKLNQEITGNQFVVELAAGESSSVVVTKAGTWGYHDHLQPSLVGTVVVQ